MTVIGLIIIATIGFLLTFLDNKNKFNSEFYSNLNLNQLENELIAILDEILEKHDSNSKFTQDTFESLDVLDCDIASYRRAIIEKDKAKLKMLKNEFYQKKEIPSRFHILSKNNGWQKEFTQINRRFSYIYSAFMNYYETTH